MSQTEILCQPFKGMDHHYNPVVDPWRFSSMSSEQLNDVATCMNKRVDDYCAELASANYLDDEQKNVLFNDLLIIRRDLFKLKEKDKIDMVDMVIELSQINFNIHRFHASILKYIDFNRQSRQYNGIIYGIMIGCALVIVVFTWFTYNPESGLNMTVVSSIGVPVSVILWALIGSFASILSRYYKKSITRTSQVRKEIRWLIARPIVGVIMGLVSYILIRAGLSVLGGINLDNQPIRSEFFCAAAFLAGFSDRFFETFIRNIIGNNITDSQKKENQTSLSKT